MTQKSPASSSRKSLLNILLIAVAVFTLYQVYALTLPSRGTGEKERDARTQNAVVEKNVVQVNVLNGCGVGGVGQRMTSFLRSAGYDVVEMGNYKTYDVKRSLVIDRSGSGEVAQKIAADLGIDSKNVVQQITPEYFVTASVVIGKDFKSLRAWK